jgi:Carboxypeptidase regulatory-like domain
VRDEHGNAVRGAQVRLFEAGARRRDPAFTSHEMLRQELLSATTAADGSFRFDLVKPSKKMMVIVHPGHKTFRQVVDLSPVKSGAPLKVMLEPAK